MKSIGLINKAGMVPRLVRKKTDGESSNVTVWALRNSSIPLKTWQDRQAEIETVPRVAIVRMSYGKGNQRVDIPHILIGGSTGSGKSALLKILILQLPEKGARVVIADFKGGVDFPAVWRGRCSMCYDEKYLLALLDVYITELEARKEEFSRTGQPVLTHITG